MADQSAFRVIVAGTDGSTLAERAVAHAARLASQDGAELHLVTAFPDSWPQREQYASSARATEIDLHRVADETLARGAARAAEQSVEADRHAVEGDPAEALIATAEEVGADLIVVGSRGLSSIGRFTMGSVSHKVFHHAPCSVMVIHR